MSYPPRKSVFKKTVESYLYGASRYTGYINKSRYFKLECGHEDRRKASVPYPQNGKMKCRQCTEDLFQEQFRKKTQ